IVFNSVHFMMGEPLLLRAFVVIVLGGLGSIPGALISGLLIGIIQTLTVAYLSAELADALVFSILFLVLLIRPTGLFHGVVATAVGPAAGMVVAISLARLRRVFHARATLGLVQIVLSITLKWVKVTDGALGINGIPNTVGLVGWLCVVVVLAYVMSALG